MKAAVRSQLPTKESCQRPPPRVSLILGGQDGNPCRLPRVLCRDREAGQPRLAADIDTLPARHGYSAVASPPCITSTKSVLISGSGTTQSSTVRPTREATPRKTVMTAPGVGAAGRVSADPFDRPPSALASLDRASAMILSRPLDWSLANVRGRRSRLGRSRSATCRYVRTPACLACPAGTSSARATDA